MLEDAFYLGSLGSRSPVLCWLPLALRYRSAFRPCWGGYGILRPHSVLGTSQSGQGFVEGGRNPFSSPARFPCLHGHVPCWGCPSAGLVAVFGPGLVYLVLLRSPTPWLQVPGPGCPWPAQQNRTARRSQEEPGGARRGQEEPGRSRMEPGGARRSQEGLGGARRSKEEPGGGKKPGKPGALASL